MCKYCEEGKNKLLPFDYSNTDFSIKLDEENYLNIEYENEMYECVRFEINHCPMCGRKLEVE